MEMIKNAMNKNTRGGGIYQKLFIIAGSVESLFHLNYKNVLTHGNCLMAMKSFVGMRATALLMKMNL